MNPVEQRPASEEEKRWWDAFLAVVWLMPSTMTVKVAGGDLVTAMSVDR
jgi:hypothetical protein